MNDYSRIACDLLAQSGVRHNTPQLTPIHGGRSGALTFRIDAADQRYVLRLQPEERFAEHFSQLVVLQRLAGDREIAPRVLAVDLGARALLSQYVANEPMFPTLRGPRGAAVLEHLGSQLGTLHTLPAPSGLSNRCPTERTRWAFANLTGEAPEFARQAAGFAERVPPAPASAVCHLDLNPSNLLFDGERVRVVDWETAGLGDPAFDLATLVNLLVLNPSRAAALYAGYASVRELPDERALFAARRRVYLAYGVEFLRLAAAPAPDWPMEDLPRLMEVYAAMSAGKLDMATREGQWRLGAAYLGELFRLPAH